MKYKGVEKYECWKEGLDWTDSDLEHPNVLEMYT
jgi:hypothetical protein